MNARARAVWLPVALALAAGLLRIDQAGADPRHEQIFREEFEDLSRWEPLYFPSIEKHSTYSVLERDGVSALKAESDASASGLVLSKTFDVYQTPIVSWRWRVDTVYRTADWRKKSGDDYPLRVYVLFKYDPKRASLFERATYAAAKLRYGEYPPAATLNYVWASKPPAKKMYFSPYTDQAALFVRRSGEADLGTWLEETVDVVKDYKRAFGTLPPKEASLAIMNDADNTGEASVAYMDFIELRARSGEDAEDAEEEKEK